MAGPSTAPKPAAPVAKPSAPAAKATAPKSVAPAARAAPPPLPVFARPRAMPESSAPGAQPAAPGGVAMLPHVQDAIERSFAVNLGGVQVHAGEDSVAANELFAARAFTYGNHIFLGKGAHPGDLPLVAHEAAHVVQQQGAPAVQRSAPGQTDSFEREAERASAAVVRGEGFTVSERVSSPAVQRLGLSDVLDYIADKANYIPGFPMFTLVLGVNPINMRRVERTAANVMRAVVEFIPGGPKIVEALDKYGVFEKVGTWVDQQIATLGLIGSSIKKALDDFLDSLGLRDLVHPGDVLDRAEHIFTDPIDRIKKFVSGLVDGIIKFVKDAILTPLAELASKTRAWDLLIAILGKNPITGEKVPQDAETIVGGLMKLIGEEELWNNAKKAHALPRIAAWFKTNLATLIGFVSQIPGLFIDALKSLTIEDIIILPQAFKKVAAVFGEFAGKFVSWAGNAVWDLLTIIFEVVAPAAIPYLRKAGAAFKSILKNPIGFVGNLVKAGKLGFHQFADNIGTHLKAAFIEWLTGTLTGVYLPKSFDLREIVMFIFSVLSLTWQSIRQKLVKAIGEPAVKAMETGFDIVVTLVKDGPAAAWEKIKEDLSSLKDTVIQGIMDFVTSTIVKKAIEKIVSLLVPGGAFIQAIVSIYDTIMVFIDKLAKIIQVATAFLDSMMDIASGAIAGAAKKVESTLAGLITLAISFLAGFLGLGKIGDKVMGIITKIRDTVDKALDKVVGWIVSSAKKLFAKVFEKGEGAEPGAPVGDVRAQASAALQARISGDVTMEQAKGIVAQIADEYRPLGLKSLEIGPETEQGESAIFAEASPRTQLLALQKDIPALTVPKSVSESMATKIDSNVPLIDQESVKIGSANPGRKLVGGAIGPQKNVLRVATWNTTAAVKMDSRGHAEYEFSRWFVPWFAERKEKEPAFVAGIEDITISLNPWSPCPTCAEKLAGVLDALHDGRTECAQRLKIAVPTQPIRANVSWIELYTPSDPRFDTKSEDVALLMKSGWIAQGPKPAGFADYAIGLPKFKLHIPGGATPPIVRKKAPAP